MFDITKMNEYREGNRLEVKAAQKGLPGSLWETYSSFANTNGGIVLLGVEENDDKSLRTSGVSDPDKLIKIFWDTINNRNKASVNILRDSNVYTGKAGDKDIIVIEVPRALRQDRPVYIDGNPYGGTYRRNGEGDYKCTKSEVNNMIRDSCDVTQDRTVLEKRSLDVLDKETVTRYRMRFSNFKLNHVWTPLPDEVFLQKIGAINRGDDGILHPTIAGLLLFGQDTEIVKEFPNYFLDYREILGKEGERWSDRVTSGTGDWSGNLYDFYYRIQDRLTSDVKVPFVLRNGQDRIDETRMHEARREALANALIHSDYNERRGIVVEKKKTEIVISNPGALRISKEEALNGGVSDPRNSVLFTMFSLVGIGERAGSGLMKIEVAWKEENLPAPILSEQFNPDRTILVLPLTQNDGVKDGVNVGTNVGVNVGTKLTKTERKIFELLGNNGRVTASDLAAEIVVDVRTIERGLKKLKDKNFIEHVGPTKSGEWKILKN